MVIKGDTRSVDNGAYGAYIGIMENIMEVTIIRYIRVRV